MVYNYIKGRDVMKTVLIAGLGLMGGSIAKALIKTKKYKVIGYDKDSEVLNTALETNAVSDIWDGKCVTDADVILVCLAPALTLKFVRESIDYFKTDCILSDICGVKRQIVDELESIALSHDIFYVGGHPMAGREKSGFLNSTEDLFQNRSYILTKTENTSEVALDALKNIAVDIGCSDITVTTPEEHDRMIAFTSQIPHVLAGAYIKSPQSDSHRGYSAGSYHDVSRVASVDENLWTDLFLLNRDNLINELDILINNLSEYKTALVSCDEEGLKTAIMRGRILKERDIKLNGNEKPHKFG